MKAILFFSILMLAAAPQRCADDTEEEKKYDEVGYVAEDIAARRALEEWEEFIHEADSTVNNAHTIITDALQKLDDPATKNRLQLKMTIAKAESKLEQLDERLQRGKGFNTKSPDYSSFDKMEKFKEHFIKEKESLDKDLEHLKSF